jgi:hypothetical protein
MAGVSLTLALLMIDQIPNASINPIIWLIMSIQFGRAENLANYRKEKSIPEIDTVNR